MALRESGAFVPRWRAALVGGGVWASWDRRHRRVCVVLWGRRGFSGSARAPGEWGVRPVRTRRVPQTLCRARGAASVRLGAAEPRSTTRRRHRCHSSAGEPLVPRLTDSAVARLLWGTSEQRQRRRVSVTSSEGVYGVLSVTKTQRPTMGNARLAKLNDRVEKTGSGLRAWPKTPHQRTHEHSKVPLRHLRRKKPRFHKNSKRAVLIVRLTIQTQHITQAPRSPQPRARRPPPAPPHRTPRRPTSHKPRPAPAHTSGAQTSN